MIASAQSGDPMPLKRVCIEAHARTQRHTRIEELVLAREAALTCAAPACPEPVRAECAAWFRDLERSVPTLRLQVTDAAGVEVTNAEIYLDGIRTAIRVAPQEMRLDPGGHEIVVRTAGGARGRARVTVLRGDPPRSLVMVLSASTVPGEARAKATTARRRARGRARGAPHPDRTLTHALLAGGLTGLAAGGYMAWIAHRGPEGGSAATQPRLIAAGTFLGLSVIAVGSAVYLLLTEDRAGGQVVQKPHNRRTLMTTRKSPPVLVR
jgi:hypothetical protein